MAFSTFCALTYKYCFIRISCVLAGSFYFSLIEQLCLTLNNGVQKVSTVNKTKSTQSTANNINKTDLINSVSTSTKLSKADSTRAVDAIIQSIQTGLKQGKEIRLVGFGTFKVTKRKATQGRNPRTGEKLHIKEKKLPKFSPGKALKEAVSAS